MLAEGKQVYVDGNCFVNGAKVAKAGAGIVQEVGSSPRYNKIGHALPSYLDQSAVVAEIIALKMASVYTPIGLALTLITDCAAVFYGCMHRGMYVKFKVTSRHEPDKVEYEGVTGRQEFYACRRETSVRGWQLLRQRHKSCEGRDKHYTRSRKQYKVQ